MGAVERFGETYESWPHIAAVSGDGKWRIIVSDDTAPTTRWILQRRRSPLRWENDKFCQSKIGLQIFAAFDPILKVAVDGLPPWCPQFDVPEAQAAPAASTLPATSEIGL